MLSDKCVKHSNSSECVTNCRREGHLTGQVTRNQSVCPFEYLCSCIPCPMVNQTACDMSCAENGSVPINRLDETGCQVCRCQCKRIECALACHGYQYEIINNTSGCPDCNCSCPTVDCDTPCEGAGLGIVINDTNDCPKCYGCINVQRQGSIFSLDFLRVDNYVFNSSSVGDQPYGVGVLITLC